MIKKNGIIAVELSYPDSSRDEKVLILLIIPIYNFKYNIKTEAVGQSIKVTVDLDKPLPEKWAK